jgi:hypothetical protein
MLYRLVQQTQTIDEATMLPTQQNLGCTRKDYLYYWSEMKFRYYTVGDLSISSRVLKHWKEKGVIPENPTLSWSRFTFVELLWLLMVEQLRQFGYPLSKLRMVRHYLFENVDPNEFRNDTGTQLEPMKFYEVQTRISNSIFKVLDLKIQVYLRVFADGGCELHDETKNVKDTVPCIVISLFDLIKRFNMGCISSGLLTNPAFLSKEEVSLFRIINSMKITRVDIDNTAQKSSKSYDVTSWDQSLLYDQLLDAILIHGYTRIFVRHGSAGSEISCDNLAQQGSD